MIDSENTFYSQKFKEVSFGSLPMRLAFRNITFNKAPPPPLPVYYGVLAGKITIKGEDITNANVKAFEAETDKFVGSAISGEDGSYRIEGLNESLEHYIVVIEPSGEWEYRVKSRLTPIRVEPYIPIQYTFTELYDLNVEGLTTNLIAEIELTNATTDFNYSIGSLDFPSWVTVTKEGNKLVLSGEVEIYGEVEIAIDFIGENGDFLQYRKTLNIESPMPRQNLSFVTNGNPPNSVTNDNIWTSGPGADWYWHKASSNKIIPMTQKTYFEVKCTEININEVAIGIAAPGAATNSMSGGSDNAGDGTRVQFFSSNGRKRSAGNYENYASQGFVSGDIIGVAINPVGATYDIEFFVNGVSKGIAYTFVKSDLVAHVCAYTNNSSFSTKLEFPTHISYPQEGYNYL